MAILDAEARKVNLPWILVVNGARVEVHDGLGMRVALIDHPNEETRAYLGALVAAAPWFMAAAVALDNVKQCPPQLTMAMDLAYRRVEAVDDFVAAFLARKPRGDETQRRLETLLFGPALRRALVHDGTSGNEALLAELRSLVVELRGATQPRDPEAEDADVPERADAPEVANG